MLRLPSRIGMKKCFLENQFSIHAVARKEKHYEFEPFGNFSCLTIWILHISGFCVMMFPLFNNFVLSHVFSYLLVVFLNTITLNLILCLCVERPAMFSFRFLQQSVWHRQCSEIHKFLCVYVIPNICYVLINPRTEIPMCASTFVIWIDWRNGNRF